MLDLIARRAFVALLLVGGIAVADEAVVRKNFQAAYPGAVIDNIQKAPLPGLYEVFSDGRILYTDAAVSHVLQGTLVDVGARRNLTEERLKTLSFLPFRELPFAAAIKFVKGSGERQVAVFSDPDCPFCRNQEQTLAGVDNVTIHIFLYPIEQLHRGSTDKARRIWCAADRSKAWREALLQRATIDGPASCDNPVDKLVQFGRRHRISGTPTMIFPDDNRVAGAVTADRLEALLDEAARKSRKTE